MITVTRYFLGDAHLGHLKVAKLRFPDVPEHEVVAYHDHHLLSQLRTLLKVGDELWMLGDISSGKPQDEDWAIAALRGLRKYTGATLHLISGNHDSCSSIHRDAHKQQRRFFRAFDSIQDFARKRFHGQQVLFSHYPYARSGDGANREGARYLEYRLPDLGGLLVHAHTHQSRPHMPKYYDLSEEMDGSGNVFFGWDTQQLCVSWDAHRRPIHEGDIDRWVQEVIATKGKK